MRAMTAVQGEATDEMLMVRYQRGDRGAFAELVRRYQVPVYNFAFRLLHQASMAEDVTQEVFLRIVQRAAEFKHEARFSTWLFTIAHNLCVDQQRKLAYRQHPSLDQPAHGAATEVPLGEHVLDPHPRAATERAAPRSEVALRIVEAVSHLPEEQREVFLLREIAGLPFREIAEVTGAGENTVKSRMRYALDRLQEALADFEEYARALR